MDADLYRSASHLAAIDHLAGPFVGGARDTPLPLDAHGHAHVDGPLRHPMLLATCKAPLGAAGLTVAVTVATTGVGAPSGPVAISFGPCTEAGASLPVFAADPADQASQFYPAIDAIVVLGDAPAGTVAADAIELRVVEGLLGRLLYVAGAEKQRIRRQACAMSAARRVAGAASSALDRLGAELGVPRLQDTLAWNAAIEQPTSQVAREDDASYRRRLAIFRPFRSPTLGALLDALDGGTDTPGLLAALGFTGAVSVQESNADIAIAVRLMSSGPNPDFERLRFLDMIRCTYLLMPSRPLPTWWVASPLDRIAINAMLARLQTMFMFPADAHVSRYLAQALDRVGRVRAALGATTKWAVLRTQDSAGGSRFELGLGIEAAMPVAAELDTMAANATAQHYTGTVDYELGLVLGSLSPQPSTADPQGRWLLAACGLRTVHTTAAGLYLSHLPFHALRIDTTPGTPAGLSAMLSAPGDEPIDARLHFALQDALAAATAAGVPAPTVLSPADASAAFAQASVVATTPFDRAGLRLPASADDVARAVAGLAGVPPEAMRTLRLDATMAAGVLANADAAVAQLAALVGALRSNEVVSALPLATSGSAVLLVVGVVSLPAAAVSLNSSATGFVWYALPVRAAPGMLAGPTGPRNTFFAPIAQSLTAVVVVSPVRAGQEDPRGTIAPYQVQLDMPAGQRLDLAQFEFLMNMLRRHQPLGVVIDTRRIRESHVDPDGRGAALPMTGRHSHAYREFRQRRAVGLVAPDNQE